MEDCGDKRSKTTTEEDWGDKRLRTTEEDDAELLSIVASEVIAKRLPAKSDIGSCRLVSKVWRSVMSTCKFNREYRKNHPVTIDEYKLAVFKGDSDKPGFLTFPLGCCELPPPPLEEEEDILCPPLRGVSVLASVDGLLVAALEREEYFTLMIVNPLLLRAKMLPLLPDPFILSPGDPVGFYIDDHGDYKVVCLGRDWLSETYGAFVYSHTFRSWTQLSFSNHQFLNHPGEIDTLPYPFPYWSRPTSWCKCIYFSFTYYHSGNSRIMCFDVDTQTFRETPFPRPPQEAENFCYIQSLAVLDGRLHLYLSDPDYPGLPVQVWKVKDDVDVVVDDKDWVKVGSIVPLLCHHHVFTESAGNWVAVLDERQNSFQKMDAEDFKAHYPHLLLPFSHYRLDRVIYVPCFVDPCPGSKA